MTVPMLVRPIRRCGMEQWESLLLHMDGTIMWRGEPRWSEAGARRAAEAAWARIAAADFTGETI